MIRVAMIGFGGIAQAHRYAYWLYNKQGMPVKLVAACDTDISRFHTVTKINIALRGEITDEIPFNQYTDWKEMLEKEQPDLVDICLPTKFHHVITNEVLNMGYSVMCEKPMSESYEQCIQMVDTAKKNNKQLMIAQCVRFQPEYEYLQKAVESGVYGKVLASSFYRVSPIPTWGGVQWRAEAGKAGSCLTELNIHDIDVIRWIFGNPQSVCCKLESKVYPYDCAHSKFMYEEHTVKIISAWYDENTKFDAGFEVIFEKGVLKYKDWKLSFADNNGNSNEIIVEDADGVMGEIKYFANILNDGNPNTKNPPEESAKTIYTLEKLFESADLDGMVLKL